MNPIQRVPGALFSPGHCFICGGHEGEMLDTKVDFGNFRYYICVRMCAPMIAKELGGSLPAGIVATTCTATRKDGTPCTAYALPGRETCVAHSRARKPEPVEV